MVDDELKFSAMQVEAAKTPLDVFGHVGGATVDDKLDALRSVYFHLARVVAPDKYPGNPAAQDVATKALQKLAEWKKQADDEIRKGSYGQKPNPVTIKILGKDYTLDHFCKSGDIADLYRVKSELIKRNIQRPFAN